jgi:hypothetical protein
MPSQIDPSKPTDGVPAGMSDVPLTRSVTSMMLPSSPAARRAVAVRPKFRQDASARMVAWQGAVQRAGGPPPPVTAGSAAIPIDAHLTRDCEATWFGFLGAQDFS